MGDASEAATLVALVGDPGGAATEVAGRLRDAGYQVAGVATAEACLSLLDERAVDVVVGAVDLPSYDAADLVRAVRGAHPGVPVVLAPAPDAGSESLAGRVLAAGADGYVPAAAGVDVLFERVGTCVDQEEATPSREGEQRYRHLVETSPAPINLFDADGTCVWGNDALLDLLGLDDRDELVGRSIFEFIHVDDHETARRELRAVVEEKRAVGPTRMQLVRDDGELRDIQVATAPGRYGDRDVGQAVVVDVTPLLEAEASLREERRFVERALDGLEDVFFVVDEAGELQRWNQRAVAASGYDEETFATLGITDIVADHHVDRALASVATALSEGSDVVELDVLTADGHAIPYEFRCRHIDVGLDGRAGVVGIGRDVSEQRERERQLQHFAQLFRHNVRTEMTVVLGLAEEIERETDGETAAMARRIGGRGEALLAEAEAVKQLVSMLARPGEATTVDLTTVARRRAEAASERHPGAAIAVDAPDGVEAVALPRIGDAVAELIENAVRHSDRETPSVAIAVDRSGESAAVTVADDGPGIPSEEREILAADREISQLQHGSGIGLWFVHWVARLSDGHLAFADNDPRGSVVTLSLPAAE